MLHSFSKLSCFFSALKTCYSESGPSLGAYGMSFSMSHILCCSAKTHFTSQMACSCRITHPLCMCVYDTALCVSMQVHNTDLALMVPTADLANHSFQQNSVYTLRASQGSFEMKTCRSVKDGEAICISYGADKTNAELMRDYGFFVPGNPHDRLDCTVTNWQQHSGFVSKPATLLFKALNGSPAPLKEEERPQLLAGPFLKALGLAGKAQAGKVPLCVIVLDVVSVQGTKGLQASL